MPFITPNNLPTGLFCRQILIPNDPYWIGLVSGALLPFIYPSEWEQKTGISPEAAAARWSEMLDQYWMSECEGDDGMPCEGGCPEVLKRVNPDTAQLEISTDGGSTWRLDPNSPMTQVLAQPPPVPAGVSATKCDAATNGKQHIEDVIAASSAQLGTAITVFDLAVGVCTALLDIVLIILSAGSLLVPATALAAAIWGAAHAAFELGQTAFDANWTSDEKDKILCKLFCNIQDDGSFTQAGYDQFLSDWKSVAVAGPAFNFVYRQIQAVGLKGLNNMCSYGESADADCSACDCPVCDISAWNVLTNGIEISRDEVSITVQATLAGSFYTIDLSNHVFLFDPGANYSDGCCQWRYECIVGGTGDPPIPVHANKYVPCGQNYTANLTNIPIQPVANANLIELSDAAPFTVVFTLA